jgi:hypothetical protein
MVTSVIREVFTILGQEQDKGHLLSYIIMTLLGGFDSHCMHHFMNICVNVQCTQTV